MREIKFRAKILGHKGYIYGTPFNQHFDKEFANKWFDSMHGFDKNGEVIDEYIEQETLSQFTGLHDKNGKEIYEGDIVEWTLEYLDYEPTKHITEIKYALFTDGFIGFEVLNKAKVIGNIHENPELLTK